MAAVAELSFLLVALISNIHAEELIIIREERDNYTFKLPEGFNSCLISRFVGEEKLVLWNTSDLWSQNSTLPEDLKQRLSVVSRENISSYVIRNLDHSDSGPYQEECWTDGKVKREKNIIITVCSGIDREKPIPVRDGETVELPCFGALYGLDIQWLKRDFRYGPEVWTRVFGDNTTSGIDNVRGRYQMDKNTSALLVSNSTTTDYTVYTCLVMNQQQCVSSSPVQFSYDLKVIYRSVEETAVLPCTVTDSTDDKPPRWINELSETELGQENQTVYSVDQNYSLVFSSLMLNQSGMYSCKTSMRMKTYTLVVCPKFGPPAVELFSLGEKVTLRCKDWEKGVHAWFIKSNQTEGRIFSAFSDLSNSFLSRVNWYSNGSLVISNVTLKDTGEYWCAVLGPGLQCMSTTKTLLLYRDPFGIHSTFYKVRCAVLSVGLVMLCVVVVAVNQRTKS